MRMLPGIVEKDLDLFGSSINAIQELGFKKVERVCSQNKFPNSWRGCVQREQYVRESGPLVELFTP